MSSNILDDIAPCDLELPEKFRQFREVQCELVDFVLYGPEKNGEVRRFMMCGAPPGSGKTLVAQAIAKMSGAKTVILTATKALEDQIVNDGFLCSNIRGKANYQCEDYDQLHTEQRWNCDEGLEHACQFADRPVCPYRARLLEAQDARVVVTNVAYWLHARANNRHALETADEPIELLIADEMHLAFNALAGFLGVWVSNQDLRRFADKEVREALAESKGEESGRLEPRWTDALVEVWKNVTRRMREIAREYETEAQASRGSKEYRALEKLSGNLARIVTHAQAEELSREERMREGEKPNWLWRLTKSGIAFDCIWPGRYAERYLWSGVPRVVGLSASLRPKALGLLNMRQGDYWFREWARIFPAELSPVYWVPTGRMGHKTPTEEKWKSIVRADEIYDEWREYKGIVHTTSYQNAEWYQANCKWGRHMVLSKPGEQGIAAEKYKLARAPCLLVSPSFTTGWDFPEEDCGFQHIPKLPFPDRSDPVLLARVEDDDSYYSYLTMQTLFQACGRKSRRPDQRCTTIITDDAVKGFRNYAAQYAPRYFRVRDSKGVPKAPKRVE